MSDLCQGKPLAAPGSAPQSADDPARKGLLYALSCFGIWGLSPAYWKLLAAVSPFEILAHRILWALIFVTVLLRRRRELGSVFALVRSRKVALALAGSTLLVSVNWLVFIWSVSAGRVLEASLGYYINPLVSVALGALVLGERLNRTQTIAVALACIAVLVLTVSLGTLPWVSLVLAGTFGFYGLLRKTMPVSALQGHFAETLACAPIALAYLIWLAASGAMHFGNDWGTDALLILAGPVTGVPMMLFALAARRLRLSTLGLTQYLAPSLQFLLAVALFGETFRAVHGLAFGLIWLGLGLFSMDSIRRERRLRRGVAP